MPWLDACPPLPQQLQGRPFFFSLLGTHTPARPPLPSTNTPHRPPQVTEFAAHRIDSPPTSVTTTVGELSHFFRTMVLMRRLEIAADQMYKSKLIRGFCHLYDGQEAVIVGLEAASTKADSIITSYRDHCTYLGRGGTPLGVMAELMGKANGGTSGMGGSMHFYSKEHNFYGGQGIVGAQVPVGAGLAFAHKYRGDGGVAYAMYGDGAANQGQIFEAFNIAALWSLPAVFVCENNHYGMGTADWRGAKSASYYTRGDYMPGLKVDGMDVLAVKQGVAFAKAHAVATGPIVLEVDTYRYHGHSMSDPGSTYRTRDEVSGVRTRRDPIELVRRLLTEAGGVDPAELKAVEREVKKEVDAAVEGAKAGPVPPAEALWRHVYVDPLGAKARGVDQEAWTTLAN